MLDTVVISSEDVCCSVVFDTLVGVLVFSVMRSELLMTSSMCYPMWSSVYEKYLQKKRKTDISNTVRNIVEKQKQKVRQP